MKKILLSFLILTVSFGSLRSQTYAASNFTLVSLIDPEPNPNPSGDKYSACWGWYQANKNKEYAIACSQSGTYWIDVTVPATPTVSAYRLGAHMGATWREVKSYQNFCYVASDDGGTNRFQIFDMQYLPDSVHKVHDSQSLFKRGHAMWVDGNKLYVSSVTYSNNTFSSLNVYSLATPSVPVLLRRLDQDYPNINHAHDCFVRNDSVFASCGYQGLYVFKLTASNTFSMVSSLTAYPFSGYNHSSALTPNGQTLVFLDEVPASMPIKVANVSNLQNIQVLATTNQYSLTTPHNPFIVSNQYCFVSSYQDGLQLFDISNPSSPFLAGYFDTYPQAGGNNNTYAANNDYEGQWGCYPFFPSKNIFALDQKNGVFMLSTNLYQNVNNVPNVGYTVAQGSICPGGSVSFSNTTTGATSYNWTFAGGVPATSTATDPIVMYNMPGTYNVILSASNGSFSSSTNGTVYVSPQIFANSSFTNASCTGCSDGVAKVNASGGSDPYTYTWSPSGGNAATANSLTPGCYTVTIQNVHGCVTSKSVCLGPFAGIQNYTPEGLDVKIYPNPAKTFMHVELLGRSFNLKLYNASGALVLTASDSFSSTLINVSELARGFYLLEIESGGEKIQKKLIIEQ